VFPLSGSAFYISGRSVLQVPSPSAHQAQTNGAGPVQDVGLLSRPFLIFFEYESPFTSKYLIIYFAPIRRSRAQENMVTCPDVFSPPFLFRPKPFVWGFFLMKQVRNALSFLSSKLFALRRRQRDHSPLDILPH